jgi:hypothetical protein
MAVTEQQALTLLNFDVPLEVPVLEAVVGYLDHGNPVQVSCRPCGKCGSVVCGSGVFESKRKICACVCNALLQGKMASNIMTQFKNHEKAWTRVHQILEQAQQQSTKVCQGGEGGRIFFSSFLSCSRLACSIMLALTHAAEARFSFRTSSPGQFFALQILEDLIKTQWKVLPAEQTEGPLLTIAHLPFSFVLCCRCACVASVAFICLPTPCCKLRMLPSCC